VILICPLTELEVPLGIFALGSFLFDQHFKGVENIFGPAEANCILLQCRSWQQEILPHPGPGSRYGRARQSGRYIGEGRDTGSTRTFMVKDIMKTLFAVAGHESKFEHYYSEGDFAEAQTIAPVVKGRF
jgi:hypothetical protein